MILSVLIIEVLSFDICEHFEIKYAVKFGKITNSVLSGYQAVIGSD